MPRYPRELAARQTHARGLGVDIVGDESVRPPACATRGPSIHPLKTTSALPLASSRRGDTIAVVEYRALGQTGLSVSLIGYGASPLGNEFGVADADEGAAAVRLAIERGINFFDVSPYYGRTLAEDRLGRTLEGVRDKVVLATKCGRYGREPDECDYSAKRVTASVEESLRRLRTDYVDLIQVHDVENVADVDQIIGETIPALREVQRAGKARAVGITGLPLKILRHIASRVEVDTILSFCRYNLMVADMDELLTPVCRERGIGLINAAPLHMRILAATGAPDWHPAPAEVKAAGMRVVEVCRRRGVDVGRVAMRYCLEHPYVSSTLVGMSKRRHVEENLAALETPIDWELLAEIEKAVGPVKDVMWEQGRSENNDQHWTRPS